MVGAVVATASRSRRICHQLVVATATERARASVEEGEEMVVTAEMEAMAARDKGMEVEGVAAVTVEGEGSRDKRGSPTPSPRVYMSKRSTHRALCNCRRLAQQSTALCSSRSQRRPIRSAAQTHLHSCWTRARHTNRRCNCESLPRMTARVVLRRSSTLHPCTTPPLGGVGRQSPLGRPIHVVEMWGR